MPVATAPLESVVAQFHEPRGYLSAASVGIPPRCAVEALRADLDRWASADRDPRDYDGVVERTRAAYGRLVGVDPGRVAIGSQTSVLTAVAAAAAPAGAEVLLAEGDFSSLMAPFVCRGDLRIRVLPLDALADAVTESTWLVAVSHIQSATGCLADTDAIVTAARRTGARVLCDTTQSAGVHPVDASRFDFTVCHAYKWLCAPRGVAFLTATESAAELLRPLHAGWYAGADVWCSTYGHEIELAADMRRFDVSPAWQAWVGAEKSIELFSALDIAALWARASGLGDELCRGLGIPEQHQAIVTWPDADGRDLHRLAAAGIRAAARAGRLRAAFHLWNDESDVEGVLRALQR